MRRREIYLNFSKVAAPPSITNRSAPDVDLHQVQAGGAVAARNGPALLVSTATFCSSYFVGPNETYRVGCQNGAASFDDKANRCNDMSVVQAGCSHYS
jgi:hypothetical protein